MIETICDPYGKAAFPMVVKCDGCGETIEYGGWSWRDCGKHYCDACHDELGLRGLDEFRICDRCHKVMWQGFCNEGGEHICEDCWDAFKAEEYPDGFRLTPDDEYEDDDDYYQAYDKERGEWYTVGWFWTQWD
jgi:hypothetical protein